MRGKAWGHELHFVFVDNGSTDITPKFLRTVDNSTVIRNDKNTYTSHAWNQGLERALGFGADVIMLVNNDVIAGRDWMEAVEREIPLHGHDRYFLPNKPFYHHAFLDQEITKNWEELEGKKLPGKSGWALFFRPDAVEKFLPIPEVVRIWHNDDWVHYKLVLEHGYYREILLDSVFLHKAESTIGRLENLGEIIAADRCAFENLVGMTVEEFSEKEVTALEAYRKRYGLPKGAYREGATKDGLS
tara:strand:+ start:4785 stop:5516 length:732 start_codon:yes stop_codon:yes gene_type:complete